MIISLRVQLDDEAGAGGVGFVDAERAVHLGGEQGTDGKAQAVALSEITHIGEGLEQGRNQFGVDGLAAVGDDELDVVRAALLGLKGDIRDLLGSC